MPLYVIERAFAEELELTGDDVRAIDEINADEGVRWLFSFLSADRRHTYCLYEAPSPDAIRAAAERANVPADAIVEVRASPHRSSPRACASGPPPLGGRTARTARDSPAHAMRVLAPSRTGLRETVAPEISGRRVIGAYGTLGAEVGSEDVLRQPVRGEERQEQRHERPHQRVDLARRGRSRPSWRRSRARRGRCRR